MAMKDIINKLEKEGYTFLIYKDEDTWVSKGINPIHARITED